MINLEKPPPGPRTASPGFLPRGDWPQNPGVLGSVRSPAHLHNYVVVHLLVLVERWTQFAGTLLYLNNPNVTSDGDIFSVPKRAIIQNIVQMLLLRLDHSEFAPAATSTDWQFGHSVISQCWQ